jgi:adenylate cyclase
MTLQAPAIIDVRSAGEISGFAKWLHGIGVRQVRLACGLVMFSYIFSHFFNHALGNISYDTMEAWLRFHVWWWRIPIVNFTLYAAATTHFLLGLWALYQRRHFRYTLIEITQLVFGLSIPLLIASHFGVVRLGGLLYGRDPPIYAAPLLAYWVSRPYMVSVQFILLTVAWTHACIGLYFWLRLKPFFKWAAPFLLAIAVLMPPLAMTGTHRGAYEATERASQPQWRAEHIHPAPPAQRSVIDAITLFYFPIFYGSAIVLVFVARGVRALLESGRGMITVSYPNRKVRVPKGLSILEASLRFNVPQCERLRRQGAMLDLPCACRQRSRRAAAAVRQGSICAGARGRRRQPFHSACVSAAATNRHRRHSRAAGQHPRRFCPQSEPRQHR